MSEMEHLKEQARRALSTPRQKPSQSQDPTQITDTFVVFPREEMEACIEALYWTLANTTSVDFPTNVRRNMLNAVKRLEE